MNITPVIQNIEKAIVGKTDEIKLILAAMLAGGHVLLEDVPGTGKTVLAKALAKSFDCSFSRIQFTPDLLPSELTGINFYSPKTGEFTFRKGGLFANIVLGDEINRATPRTQSGLLESMDERQVSVDGTTHVLPAPYFVIATQNPVETQGTFPLPEAQLDRFMLQLNLGYPTAEESAKILAQQITPLQLLELQPVCAIDDLQKMQAEVKNTHIHEVIFTYIVALAEATRAHDAVLLGVSTRGMLALARLAQAYAAISGAEFVTPQDIKHLVPCVFAHRMILKGGVGRRAATALNILEDITSSVPAPVETFKASGANYKANSPTV
ncbi:MAG: MoxR family ATPase [Defluviitaleaceae bacterium]|nr:MoxR family ATPase [Defluviitaleaceae bacterium]MCL2273572.1 MoxR family ATPase [Defluviitaleaceae bacterium]